LFKKKEQSEESLKKQEMLDEDRMYAEIALNHPDYKPKPISTEKKNPTPQ